VSIADNNAWTISASGLTVIALIRPTNSGIRDVVAKGGPVSQNEWECRGSSDEFLATTWNPNGSEYYRDTCATFPTINQWNVVSWRWSDLVGTAVLFRLNKVNITPSHSAVSGSIGNTTSPVRIGSRDHGDRFFPGAIAHVAIWTTLISTANIQTIEDAADNAGWI